MTDAPSGYKIEQAMSAWQSARSRLLQEDADLARDEAALTELLGPEEGEVVAVLERLCRAARHAEVMAAGATTQIEDIQARRDRYKSRAQSMRGAAFAMMDAMGIKKHEMADMTISVRNGSQTAMIVDEAAVPDIYVEVVTTRKIDKAVVLSVLKSGGEVPGTFLSNGLPSLTIRTK